MEIKVKINPINDKWCGLECPMQLLKNFGTQFMCRLFTESFYSDRLATEEDGSVLRHEECLKATEQYEFKIGDEVKINFSGCETITCVVEKGACKRKGKVTHVGETICDVEIEKNWWCGIYKKDLEIIK